MSRQAHAFHYRYPFTRQEVNDILDTFSNDTQPVTDTVEDDLMTELEAMDKTPTFESHMYPHVRFHQDADSGHFYYGHRKSNSISPYHNNHLNMETTVNAVQELAEKVKATNSGDMGILVLCDNKEFDTYKRLFDKLPGDFSNYRVLRYSNWSINAIEGTLRGFDSKDFSKLYILMTGAGGYINNHHKVLKDIVELTRYITDYSVSTFIQGNHLDMLNFQPSKSTTQASPSLGDLFNEALDDKGGAKEEKTAFDQTVEFYSQPHIQAKLNDYARETLKLPEWKIVVVCPENTILTGKKEVDGIIYTQASHLFTTSKPELTDKKEILFVLDYTPEWDVIATIASNQLGDRTLVRVRGQLEADFAVFSVDQQVYDTWNDMVASTHARNVHHAEDKLHGYAKTPHSYGEDRGQQWTDEQPLLDLNGEMSRECKQLLEQLPPLFAKQIEDLATRLKAMQIDPFSIVQLSVDDETGVEQEYFCIWVRGTNHWKVLNTGVVVPMLSVKNIGEVYAAPES